VFFLGDINFLSLVWSDGDLVCRGQGDPFFRGEPP